jgi:hypothetical protein
MSYAILDINLNKVVDTTVNEFGALDYVKKLHPRAIPVPLVTKSELLSEAQYRMGNYIIVDGLACELVEKKYVIDPGMIYNSRIPGLVTIGMWKTVPIADNLLRAKTQVQVQNQDSYPNPKVIDTGFESSNDAKLTEVVGKTTKPYASVNVLPPFTQVPVYQVPTVSTPAPATVPIPQIPVSVKSSTPPTSQWQQYQYHPATSSSTQIKPVLSQQSQGPAKPLSQPLPQVPTVSKPLPQPPALPQPVYKPVPKVPFIGLDQLAKNPMIFSIGRALDGQKEKIGQIMHHQIATGLISEENVIVISNGNTKNTEAWAKSYPHGLVYETLDNDILQYLIMSLSTPATKKVKQGTLRNVVVFDNCLTRTHINQQFLKFLDTVKQNDVRVVIMTEDKSLICSDVSKKFDYMFIHSFNYASTMTHGEMMEFIKKHDYLKATTMVESDMSECFKMKNSIAFDVTQPNKMFQF